MRERQSTPSSNSTNYPDPILQPRKVYGDGTPYEEITMSKRKYDSIIAIAIVGWVLVLFFLVMMYFLAKT